MHRLHHRLIGHHNLMPIHNHNQYEEEEGRGKKIVKMNPLFIFSFFFLSSSCWRHCATSFSYLRTKPCNVRQGLAAICLVKCCQKLLSQFLKIFESWENSTVIVDLTRPLHDEEDIHRVMHGQHIIKPMRLLHFPGHRHPFNSSDGKKSWNHELRLWNIFFEFSFLSLVICHVSTLSTFFFSPCFIIFFHPQCVWIDSSLPRFRIRSFFSSILIVGFLGPPKHRGKRSMYPGLSACGWQKFSYTFYPTYPPFFWHRL